MKINRWRKDPELKDKESQDVQQAAALTARDRLRGVIGRVASADAEGAYADSADAAPDCSCAEASYDRASEAGSGVIARTRLSGMTWTRRVRGSQDKYAAQTVAESETDESRELSISEQARQRLSSVFAGRKPRPHASRADAPASATEYQDSAAAAAPAAAAAGSVQAAEAVEAPQGRPGCQAQQEGNQAMLPVAEDEGRLSGDLDVAEKSSAEHIELQSMTWPVVVYTADELRRAQRSGAERIVVKGELAKKLQTAFKGLRSVGAGSLNTLALCLSGAALLAPFTGGVSLGAAGTAMGTLGAALTATAIAAISAIGFALVIAVFKGYDEVRLGGGGVELVIKKGRGSRAGDESDQDSSEDNRR